MRKKWMTAAMAALSFAAVPAAAEEAEETRPDQYWIIELQNVSETDTKAEDETEEESAAGIQEETEQNEETEAVSETDTTVPLVSSDQLGEEAVFEITSIYADEPIIRLLLQEANPEWEYDSIGIYDVTLYADIGDESFDFRLQATDGAQVTLYRMDDGDLAEINLETENGAAVYEADQDHTHWMIIHMGVNVSETDTLTEEGSEEESAAQSLEGRTEEESSTTSEPIHESGKKPEGEKATQGTTKQETTAREESTAKETVSPTTKPVTATEPQTTAEPKTEPKTEPQTTAHTHVYQESGRVAPTCAALGSVTYSCGCGASYTESIPATGQHSYVLAGSLPATCVTAGTNTYTCGVCGASYTEEIPATGQHSWQLVAQDQNNTYQCTVCGQQYSEPNPNWVSYRPATADEIQRVFNAIVSERTKNGLGAISLSVGSCGAQEWANYLAEHQIYEHQIGAYDEGVGGAAIPENAGINQCYTCLGLAALDGADDWAGAALDIGLAYSNVTGSYYYCIRCPY